MIDSVANGVTVTTISMMRPAVTVHTTLNTGMPDSSMTAGVSQVTVATSLGHGLISSVAVGGVRRLEATTHMPGADSWEEVDVE